LRLLAFRVAIGSLDIFPARQKGGVYGRFFVSNAEGGISRRFPMQSS
jgi:hypothetical protein